MPPPDAALVSVALCTFNGERHLREQLDSLLAQDWPRLEIVAVDDASTDATPDILAAYAQRDSRVRLHRNPANLGFRQNFEAAMSRCQGRYIAPCDQDDIWLPGKLSALANELKDGLALIAYCDSELIDDQGKPLGQRMSDHMNRFSTDDPLPFWFANNVSGHAMLFDRSLVSMAPPVPEGFFHDWWLAHAAASNGHIRYVDRCLVRYRQHARTVTDVTQSRTVQTDRSPGFRTRELARDKARLEGFATVPGKGQALAQELVRLWRARESHFTSARLAWFFYQHHHRIHAIPKNLRRKRFPQAMQYFWGLRTKRLIEPHRYVESN